MSCKLRVFALATVGSFLAATIGNAAVTVNFQHNVAPGSGAPGAAHDPSVSGAPDLFSASSIDLAEGLIAVYAGDTTGGAVGSGSPEAEFSTGVSAWTDGSIIGRYPGDVNGNGNTDNDPNDFLVIHDGYGTVASGGPSGSSTVTYDLGSVFQIDQVDVFMGWNDAGRDDASFTLRSSLDNSTYTDITTSNKQSPGGSEPITNYYSVSDSDPNAPIAPFARYVQFEFFNTDNAYSGVLEIDIFGVVPPFEPEDQNRDGSVNNLDFIVISDNFKTVPSAPGFDGDVNGDNFVDSEDFRQWKNYVPSLVANVESVPEPSSVLLLAVAAVSMVARARRLA